MSASAAPVRLDIAIVDRGLAPTRTKSSRLIKAGHVTVNGKVQTKPSFAVRPNDAIDVDRGDDYVSRGAYKLVGAFEILGTQVAAGERARLVWNANTGLAGSDLGSPVMVVHGVRPGPVLEHERHATRRADSWNRGRRKSKRGGGLSEAC